MGVGSSLLGSSGVGLNFDLLSELNAPSVIHLQQSRGCPTNIRQAGDRSVNVPTKMRCPAVLSRMKQTRDNSRHRIDTSEIGTFVCIAAFARHGKIIGIITTFVLPCKNMFCVEREEWRGRFR